MSIEIDKSREELKKRLHQMYTEKMPEVVMTGDINKIKLVFEEIRFITDQIEGVI